jgi:hypothetical protein
MRLWTIQDERVYDDFLEKGLAYHVIRENTMPWSFTNEPEPDAEVHSYKWMASQLAAKVGPAPEGVEFPIWAWKKIYGRNDGKPDMRSWRTTYEEHVVRLQLEIPETRVLLSDYDTWHMPLNLGYFAKCLDEMNEFEKWCSKMNVELYGRNSTMWSDSPSESERIARDKIETSWSRCLELEPTPENGYDPEWIGNWEEDSIQAVFWEILPKDIVTVERFTTRLHAGAKEIQEREAERIKSSQR